MRVDQLLQDAFANHRQGRLDKAASLYAEVLQIAPSNDDALHLLGVVAHQKGDHHRAIDYIGRAIAVRPSIADYHLNLGNAHQALGQLDQAIRCFHQALQRNPKHALAHNNLGNALKDQGRIRDALPHYAESLRWNPENALAYSNQAAVLIKLGELQSAEVSLQRAIEIDPHLAEAYHNLGEIHAIRTDTEAAACSYAHALRLNPDASKTWNNLGNLSKDEGRIEKAKVAYRQVARLRRQPVWTFRAASLCPVIPQSNEEIDDYRHRLEDAIQQLEGVRLAATPDELMECDVVPSFYLPYQGRNDATLKSRYADLFVPVIPPFEPRLLHGAPHVGFVVAGGFELIFARFMEGILNRLPSDDLKVSIACSSTGHKSLAQWMTNPRIEYVTLPGKLGLAADAILSARFDLLFYFEVGSHRLNYFLPFYQAAPVQCTSWGVPVTSGIPAIQYFLSSQLLEPEGAETHYTEQLIPLQTLPVCYRRPDRLPPRDREALGLPAREHLYCCPHSLFKFHPDYDQALAGILRSDPRGRLVLIEAKCRHWTELLMQRFQRSMPDVVDRVMFLPRQSYPDYVSLIGCCEVLLDPFPFGGGQTALEAMAVGTPTVTWPGTYMRGRATAACYRKMGVMDCVVDSLDAYIVQAVHLATVPEYRNAIKSRIVSSHSVLYDDPEAVEELRDFFLRTAHEARQI